MARKSVVARENKRVRMLTRYQQTRLRLKGLVKSVTNDITERMSAQHKLQCLPKDASPVRHNRRCYLCARPRAVYRKFGLCRICLREELMQGNIPGGRKASW